MTQVVHDAEGNELLFDFDETLAELARVLPDGHPLVQRVSDLCDSAGGALEGLEDALAEERSTPWRGVVEHVMETLDDWKRGVRDWSEVENELAVPRSWMESQA